MDSTVKNITISGSMDSLEELCNLHPDDPILQIQMGEKLFAKGRELAAIHAFRKAYRILKRENPMEAGRLAQRFGEEVALDELRPTASEDYLPLADYYGRFARMRHKLQLPEGGVLFRQGEPADAAYLILDGELAVTTELNGKPMLLNYLHSGAIVGEGAMTPGARRGATVTANRPSTLLRFSPEDLKKALADRPDLNLQFGKEAMLRRRMAMLSSVDLFARLPMDLRFLIAKRAWNIEIKAGEALREPGRSFPHAVLLVRGVVHMHEESRNERVYCGRLAGGVLLDICDRVGEVGARLALVAHTDGEAIGMEHAVVEDAMRLSSWLHRQVREMEGRLADQLYRTLILQKGGQ